MLAYWTTCSVSHECAELLEVLSYMIVYVLKFKPLYRSGTLDTCIVGYLAIVQAVNSQIKDKHSMMTSSNGNIFRVIGHLWGEFTGHRWIPLTKASDAELWCFLWSAPEQTAEKTLVTPVIWDAITPIMTLLLYRVAKREQE